MLAPCEDPIRQLLCFPEKLAAFTGLTPKSYDHGSITVQRDSEEPAEELLRKIPSDIFHNFVQEKYSSNTHIWAKFLDQLQHSTNAIADKYLQSSLLMPNMASYCFAPQPWDIRRVTYAMRIDIPNDNENEITINWWTYDRSEIEAELSENFETFELVSPSLKDTFFPNPETEYKLRCTLNLWDDDRDNCVLYEINPKAWQKHRIHTENYCVISWSARPEDISTEKGVLVAVADHNAPVAWGTTLQKCIQRLQDRYPEDVYKPHVTKRFARTYKYTNFFGLENEISIRIYHLPTENPVRDDELDPLYHPIDNYHFRPIQHPLMQSLAFPELNITGIKPTVTQCVPFNYAPGQLNWNRLMKLDVNIVNTLSQYQWDNGAVIAWDALMNLIKPSSVQKAAAHPLFQNLLSNKTWPSVFHEQALLGVYWAGDFNSDVVKVLRVEWVNSNTCTVSVYLYNNADIKQLGPINQLGRIQPRNADENDLFFVDNDDMELYKLDCWLVDHGWRMNDCVIPLFCEPSQAKTRSKCLVIPLSVEWSGISKSTGDQADGIFMVSVNYNIQSAIFADKTSLAGALHTLDESYKACDYTCTEDTRFRRVYTNLTAMDSQTVLVHYLQTKEDRAYVGMDTANELKGDQT